MSGVWVNCNNPAPSYFGGWVADMGPYIGPNPINPPAIIDGQYEVDFYVMLPNPAAPGDVTLVGDDTYPTPVWGTYRYGTGNSDPKTLTDFYVDSVGGASDPVATTRIPTGAHLYVGVGDNAPHPPSYYVPRSYAHLGRATLVTAPGHWSDWQLGPTIAKAAEHYLASGHSADGFVSTLDQYPVAWSIATGSTQHAETEFQPTYPNSHPPVMDLAATSLAEAQAQIATQIGLDSGSNDLRGHLFEVYQYVSGGFFVNYSEVSEAKAILHQGRDGWHASNQLDPVGEGLVYGKDYIRAPFGTDDFEHEAPTSTPHWRDVNNYLVLDRIDFRLTGANQDLTTNHEAECDLYVGTPPLHDMLGNVYHETDLDLGPIWIDPSNLTLVASPHLAYTANGGTDVYNGTLASAAIPFSTLIAPGTQNITTVWQPRVTLDGLFEELPDPPVPTHPATSNAYGDFTAPVIDIDPQALYTIDGVTGLLYLAVNPGWRYWIPGLIVPEPRPQGTGVPAPRIPVFRGR